jgi:LPXTG-motif cell wall-anchored protein
MAATTRRFALRRRHAGLLLMLVGAVSVIAGLVETTVSSAVSQNCPVGATLLAKFQYSGGRYVFDGPDVNRNVMTVEDGTAAGANWHSTIAVSYVIVAGGPGAITTSLSPMLYASRFSNVGLPSTDATTPDIAGVQFCRPDLTSTTPTSTTDADATTDAGASPTTVSAPTPTSTIATPTSTTANDSSTTTATASPSASVTPVTVPASTTTTGPGASTGVIDVTPTDTTIRPPHATSPAAPAVQALPAPPTSTTAVKNTVPAPTTTVAGATTTTTINPNMTGSTIPTTISPGGATSTSVYAVLASLPTARLPRTGSSSSPLIAIGIVLLGAGLGVTVVGSRRERGHA